MAQRAASIAQDLVALLTSPDPQPEAISSRLDQAVAAMNRSRSQYATFRIWFECWALAFTSTVLATDGDRATAASLLRSWASLVDNVCCEKNATKFRRASVAVQVAAMSSFDPTEVLSGQ